MGHTTRCIPLIRHLLAGGHRVTFAGNEAQRQLIRRIFPAIPWVHLQGYDVTYSRHKNGFAPALLRQLPRLLRTIRNEHTWLLAFAKAHRVDGILSDNRYGLHHPAIPAVMLTHQPALQTGLGALPDRLLRRLHYALFRKFRELWLVDQAGVPNLSGALSHPSRLPANARYIGLLSQMAPATPRPATHLLILLSGPEPQRSLLEEILWQEALRHEGPVVFIAGKAGAAVPQVIPPHITYHTHLTLQELQPLMEAATYIVTRGGYTTLMDLAVLGGKALLIPTPGQAEQQYLAWHMEAQGIFPAFQQDGFSLREALATAALFPFHPLPFSAVNKPALQELDRWLDTL